MENSEMFKVAQTGDIHYCAKNLVEADRCFGEFVSYCEQEKPNVIAIVGDSTEHRLDAHSTSFIALAKRIKQLSNVAPVILLQGTFSHEPVGTIEMLGLVGEKYPIAVANRICQIALTTDQKWIYSNESVFDVTELDGIDIKGVFTCVPTLNKANLAALDAEYAAEQMGAYIRDYLHQSGRRNAMFANLNIPTVGLSHGTVHGSKTEHGVPMMGFDHEYTSEDLFAANCSAFMLGHIHLTQRWENNGRYVAYAGSPGRYHYGEIGEKGFLSWEIDSAKAHPNFHQTSAREIKYFDFDGMPDLDYLMEQASSCEGIYVRVRWQIDAEHSQVVQRKQVEDIFAKAADVEIEIRNLRIQSVRAEGINQHQSLQEKLSHWANISSVDSSLLVERLSLLMDGLPTDIASKIIAQTNEMKVGEIREVESQ